MTINNTPETRAFLAVLDAMDKPATMADVRKRTSLNEDKRHYQFRKLEKAGIIEVTYNEWGGTSTAPMKQASLTKEGQELLDSGFLDEEFSEFQRANVDVVELSDRVDGLERKLDEVLGLLTESDSPEPVRTPEPAPTIPEDESAVERYEREHDSSLSDMTEGEYDRLKKFLPNDVKEELRSN